MGLFERLSKVRKPETALREGLFSAYATIGKEEGYSVSEQNGQLVLAKGAEKAVIELQFGNESEMRLSIRRLFDTGANMLVLATSSRVRSISFDELPKIAQNTYALSGKQFAFIDIETGRMRVVTSAAAEPQKPKAIAQQNQQQGSQQKNSEQQISAGQDRRRQGLALGGGSPMASGPRRKMIYGKRGEHKEQD